jgi:hypothetical protein
MQRKHLKAQSAMEYLMTYGWAILIVIIVAAALYSLGIFNPATYTGRIPTGFTTLGTPEDWDINSNGEVSVILKNRLADMITVHNVSVTLGSITDFNASTFTISPGEEYQYPFSASGLTVNQRTQGTTYSLLVEILYNSGGLNHTERGTLTGTISN